MVVGIPLPEVSLLPQAFQPPEQIHAALVGHGGVTVSGAGAGALLGVFQRGPSQAVCEAEKVDDQCIYPTMMISISL